MLTRPWAGAYIRPPEFAELIIRINSVIRASSDLRKACIPYEHARTVRKMDASSAALPGCFATCNTCGLHTSGNWIRRTSGAPYRLGNAQWGALGVRMKYDACDDPQRRRSAQVPKSTLRTLYDWVPQACSLIELDHQLVCSIVRGKHIMVVGDSLAGQLFLSLSSLLQATYGKNMKGSALTDVTASACNDTVRLEYARNDLVMWSVASSDFNKVSRFDASLLLGPWAERAARADVLIIDSGHHFPHMARKLAARQGTEMATTRATFPLRSINHTLANAVAARKYWGHHPSSLIMVSAPVPTKTCRRYHEPLTLDQALGAYHTVEGTLGEQKNATEFRPELVEFWLQMYQQNTQSQWISRNLGSSFVDIAPLSIRRPDGMMAHHISVYDCLHSCLPGPTDTWSLLIFNQLHALSPRLQASATHTHPSHRTVRGAFDLTLNDWLSPAKSRSLFEACEHGGPRRHASLMNATTERHKRQSSALGPESQECAITARMAPPLVHQEWWPFKNFIK